MFKLANYWKHPFEVPPRNCVNDMFQSVKKIQPAIVQIKWQIENLSTLGF